MERNRVSTTFFMRPGLYGVKSITKNILTISNGPVTFLSLKAGQNHRAHRRVDALTTAGESGPNPAVSGIPSNHAKPEKAGCQPGTEFR